MKATSRAVHHEFSKFLDMAHEGKEITITKRGQPWARLTPLPPPKKPRKVVWPNITERAKAAFGDRVVPAVETLLKMREEERW